MIGESHLAPVYDLVTNAIYSKLPALGETRMTWHCSQRVHEATQWRAPEVDAKVAKEFAVFHVIVKILGHVWRPRRSQDAAIAEFPRTELRGAL